MVRHGLVQFLSLSGPCCHGGYGDVDAVVWIQVDIGRQLRGLDAAEGVCGVVLLAGRR
jgi:hypothetical protein